LGSLGLPKSCTIGSRCVLTTSKSHTDATNKLEEGIKHVLKHVLKKLDGTKPDLIFLGLQGYGKLVVQGSYWDVMVGHFFKSARTPNEYKFKDVQLAGYEKQNFTTTNEDAAIYLPFVGIIFLKNPSKLVESKIDFSDLKGKDNFEGSLNIHVSVKKEGTTYPLKFFNLQANALVEEKERRIALWNEIYSKEDKVKFALGGFNSQMKTNKVEDLTTIKDAIKTVKKEKKYGEILLSKESCVSSFISGSDELCEWLKEKKQVDAKIVE